MIPRWFHNLNMFRRLGLAFLAVLAGSLLLVSLPAGMIGSQSLERAYQTQLDATALEKQSYLTDWFDRAGHNLQAITSDVEIQFGGGELNDASQHAVIFEHLTAWSGPNSEFQTLSVVAAGSGQILVSADSAHEGRLIRAELKAAWPPSGVSFSPIFFDNSPGRAGDVRHHPI